MPTSGDLGDGKGRNFHGAAINQNGHKNSCNRPSRDLG